MTDHSGTLEIDAQWPDRATTMETVAKDFRRFVNGLEAFDPQFKIWRTNAPKPDNRFIAPIDSETALRQMSAAQSRYDARPGGLPPKIWPELGWSFNANGEGPAPWTPGHRGRALVHVSAGVTGGMPSANSIHMLFPSERISVGRPWRASELRELLKLIVTVWSPSGVAAYPDKYDGPLIADPSSGAGMRFLKPPIGWVTYLNPDLAAKVRLPPGMISEPMLNGGMIISVSEAPPTLSDPVQERLMRAFEAAIRPLQN